jgi:proteasome lid subunit RPN8/RPN11
MNTIQLPRVLINRLFEHAQSSPREEVCGLIGISRHTKQFCCYPIKNVASRPFEEFEMAPREQIAALRTMREQKQTLFAIYHSHPTTPARPSWLDVERAFYRQTLYLIISLNTCGILHLRGFRWQTSVFQPIHLEMVEIVSLNMSLVRGDIC